MTRIYAILGGIAAVLLAVLGIFHAGAKSKSNEIKAKLATTTIKAKDAVQAATRAGQENERKVRHEDKPADFDRYR